MKPTAYLINTSRGQVIREQDLAEALNGGRLAGAAMDVLCEEPPKKGNPLTHCEKCVITPHNFLGRERKQGQAPSYSMRQCGSVFKGNASKPSELTG